MSVYIDTGIVLTAAGVGQEAADEACRLIVTAISDGRLEGVIACEMLQELLHMADWRQARSQGLELTQLALQLFPHARPITAATLQRACVLVGANPRLGVRIAMHVAAMQEAGLNEVIADDLDYGLVSGIRRWSPLEACGHFRLHPART